MYLDFSGTGEVKNMVHVGRTGSFVPVFITDGADLWRVKDEQKYAVTGTKGRKWIDREVAIDRKKADELHIDTAYFEELKQKAVDVIMQFDQFDDLEGFIS